MAIFWHPDLVRMGIEAVDRHQLQFLRNLNTLHDAYLRQTRSVQILASLIFLERYSAASFRDEEVILRQYSFPEITRHQAEHAALVRDIREFKLMLLRDGATAQLAWRVQARLCRWLVEHIFFTHRQMARLIPGRGDWSFKHGTL
ncbi:hemerythrin [Hydrogenispora ethanolica]|uniref:Hemerythrin n=1 Tax=Hydrogenispora ethanolica TaxID=1082276 RepID=A0A4V2QFK3_HYDET|nr:hemerythrin domain-containing protein [Hydrogenispora ethanolica]TCL72297.1 hemerythrin [Hydrogenispora ethanolica]